MEWQELTTKHVQSWADRTSYEKLTVAQIRYADKITDLRAAAHELERQIKRQDIAGMETFEANERLHELYELLEKAELIAELLANEIAIRRRPLLCNIGQGFGSPNDFKLATCW